MAAGPAVHRHGVLDRVGPQVAAGLGQELYGVAGGPPVRLVHPAIVLRAGLIVTPFSRRAG
jgi:hypothetical protein